MNERQKEVCKKRLCILYASSMAVLGFFGGFGIWSFGVHLYIKYRGAIVLNETQFVMMESAKYIWMVVAAIAVFAISWKIAKFGICCKNKENEKK